MSVVIESGSLKAGLGQHGLLVVSCFLGAVNTGFSKPRQQSIPNSVVNILTMTKVPLSFYFNANHAIFLSLTKLFCGLTLRQPDH